MFFVILPKVIIEVKNSHGVLNRPERIYNPITAMANGVFGNVYLSAEQH
jgi:hypothetical protein